MDHLLDTRDILRKISAPTRAKCDKCGKLESSCYCRTCGFICDKCKGIHSEWKQDLYLHVIITLDQLAVDVINHIPPFQKTLQCSKHPENQLDIYCETCKELGCNKCTVEVHQGHQYNLVSDAFSKEKKMIVASLQPVKQKIATVNAALEDLNVQHSRITQQCQTVETQIRESIQQLHRVLDNREEELISQLKQLSQEKLKTIADQQNNFELVVVQLNNCLCLVQENLHVMSHEETLTMKKKKVFQRVGEVFSKFKSDSPLPKEQANVMFVHRKIELTEACKKFGKVCALSVCPAKCQAAGPGTKVAITGELATVILYAKDKEERECKEPVEVSCELVSKDGTSQIKGKVEMKGDGMYKITYNPKCSGSHHLHIYVEETHISGSPFRVVVLKTTPNIIISDLKGPWGVAVNQRGQFVVAECSRPCISIFTASGDKLTSFGTSDSTTGQLNFPVGVGVTANGNILVSESNKDCIHLFSSEGKPLKCVGTRGNQPLQFQHPCGIAVHSQSNKIYIADAINHRIQILNHDLTYCSSFVGPGTAKGEPFSPDGIAFNKAGNVIVSDFINHRIQIFTEGGVFLQEFGKEGSEEGELKGPCAVAVDAHDVVYVGESTNHRISLFTQDGHFLRALGSEGSRPGQFSKPFGLAINKYGTIFVSDNGNGRIQVF